MGVKGLICFNRSLRRVRAEIQGRKLKGRNLSRDHGGTLVASLLSSLSYTAQTCLPREWHHQQWTVPSYIHQQLGKFPRDMPTQLLMEAVLQQGVPLPMYA